MDAQAADRGTVLFAHPSPDLYGSDRMLVESVTGVVERGWDVVVALPAEGPLAGLLRERGARVVLCPTLVLRKALLSPGGLPRLVGGAVRGLVHGARLMRAERPRVLYVNTVTVPVWPLLGRVAGVRVLVHVHEAEQDVPRAVRVVLAAPLLAASVVVVNSRATADVVASSVGRLRGRLRLVYNGVAGPPDTAVVDPAGDPPEPLRVVLVGRVSPRKGVEVAMRAVAELRGRGRPVTLDVVGAVFPGYEWFDRQVRELVVTLDLTGLVRFAGFASPVWPAYARADVAVVPSLATEPFGNVSVEAQLAGRPVIVARTQGLVETLSDGRTGLVVDPGDPAALADALERLVTDWPATVAMARAARTEAAARFAPGRYRHEVADLVDEVGRLVGGVGGAVPVSAPTTHAGAGWRR